jgi:hypothetical protein
MKMAQHTRPKSKNTHLSTVLYSHILIIKTHTDHRQEEVKGSTMQYLSKKRGVT